MKILSAENNVSYTANNACKIYIIKQVDLDQIKSFENIYAPLIKNGTSSNSFLNFGGDIIHQERKIQLTRLLSYIPQNEELYEKIKLDDVIDAPNDNEGHKYSYFYFLKSLFELRNCPIIDFSKAAYVFQIEGQSKGGLANIVSFNTNFSVNGQSSAELVLNNKDFLYNFKYFNDKEKYNLHLKSYFDTNDIVIIRYQKRNNNRDSLLNSFKQSSITYWEDPYKDSELDPFTTIFTGYINDVNDSFSFTNGQQTLTLACTGPSKKLTWTRIVTNQAPATKDSYSSLIPISAFINPQTRDENNKTPIANDDVVKNVVVRTYSGILNIPAVKVAYKKFTEAFDKANSVRTDLETSQLREQIYKLTEQEAENKLSIEKQKDLQNLQKQLDEKVSTFRKVANDARDEYNKLINRYFLNFVTTKENIIEIKRNTFISSSIFGECPSLFVINGTKQPAYQWAFQNWASLFSSDYSTVYQFIKTIADNLQFNFYDDPYGIIHFEIPDMTLMHLHKDSDPNNLSQIISFTETQNTENIANIQPVQAKYTYDIPLAFVNNVIKDYKSIDKYGEKMMQPLEIVGLTNITALQYAGKMRMAKYNRKAMSNIRVSMNGDPNLKLGRYAYIKSLRKLFYIESYSHSYNAGGDFSTSLNGTYTREILAYAKNSGDEKGKANTKRLIKSAIKDSIPLDGRTNLEFNIDKALDKSLENGNLVLNQQLFEATTVDDIIRILQTIELPQPDILANSIYNIYIQNWKYPEDDEDLRLEIGAMYNQDNLRQCFLDDFFWAIPFDCDPYKIAKQIQDKEKQNLNQMAKTKKVKTNSVVTKTSSKNLDNGIIKSIINPRGPSKAVEIEVESKSLSNIPMAQRLNLSLDTNIIKETLNFQLEQASEEQKIIDNGGSIIKGK